MTYFVCILYVLTRFTENRFAFVGRLDGRVARRRDAIRVRPSLEHVDAVQRQGEGLEHTNHGSVHQIFVDRVTFAFTLVLFLQSVIIYYNIVVVVAVIAVIIIVLLSTGVIAHLKRKK